MPFYEYECTACKFYVEALQKISEAPLRKCPSCGKQALKRLVSAPVFRLKGSGWYETDFKSDSENKRNLHGREEPAEKAAADAKADTKADTKESKTEAADKKPAESKPAEGKSTPSVPAPKKTLAARRAARSRPARPTKPTKPASRSKARGR